MTLPPVFLERTFKNGFLWTATSEPGGVILVYNRYSKQLVCNLTKKRSQPAVFFEKMFEHGWLWTAASEQFKRKISKRIFLMESF